MGCTFTVSDFIKKWWKIFFTKACLGFSYEYQGDQIHKVNLGLWFFLAVRSSLCHWEYRDGREHRLGQYTGYIPLPLLPTYSLLPPLLSFCLASYLGSSNNCFGKYRCLPSIAGEKKKKRRGSVKPGLGAHTVNKVMQLHSPIFPFRAKSGIWACPQLSWWVDKSREFSWIESRITSHPAPELNSRRELHLPKGLQITACVVLLGNRASLLPLGNRTKPNSIHATASSVCMLMQDPASATVHWHYPCAPAAQTAS